MNFSTEKENDRKYRNIMKHIETFELQLAIVKYLLPQTSTGSSFKNEHKQLSWTGGGDLYASTA